MHIRTRQMKAWKYLACHQTTQWKFTTYVNVTIAITFN